MKPTIHYAATDPTDVSSPIHGIGRTAQEALDDAASYGATGCTAIRCTVALYRAVQRHGGETTVYAETADGLLELGEAAEEDER